jgi:hypothetical protein
MLGSSRVAAQWAASQEGLSSMSEFIIKIFTMLEFNTKLKIHAISYNTILKAEVSFFTLDMFAFLVNIII